MDHTVKTRNYYFIWLCGLLIAKDNRAEWESVHCFKMNYTIAEFLSEIIKDDKILCLELKIRDKKRQTQAKAM